MSYVADTNILLRSVQNTDPMHHETTQALAVLLGDGEVINILAQNLYEFWVVATRPQPQNGLGMSVSEAEQELDRMKSFFNVLPDTPDIYKEWERLVVQYAVKGKNAHDARVVAAMKVHGVSNLLTFNGRDFARYIPQEGITAVAPPDINSAAQVLP